MTTVWVYAEVTPGGPSPSALELLTKARTIGDEVAAVALGPGATAAAPALGEHGAPRVYASDEEVYADTLGRPATHTLHALIREHSPDLVLFSTSYDARDVAGRLQAMLGSTLMSNATEVVGAGTLRIGCGVVVVPLLKMRHTYVWRYKGMGPGASSPG